MVLAKHSLSQENHDAKFRSTSQSMAMERSVSLVEGYYLCISIFFAHVEQSAMSRAFPSHVRPEHILLIDYNSIELPKRFSIPVPNSIATKNIQPAIPPATHDAL